MYWGRNLEQILFLVEGTGSWPFPSKVPVEPHHLPSLPAEVCMMIISSKAGARPPCSAPTPLLPPASLEGSWSCAGEIAQVEFPHRFINDTQFGVSLYLFCFVWGFFLEEEFFGFFICFGLFQTGAVPLSQPSASVFAVVLELGRAGRPGRDEWVWEEEGRICLHWVQH